MSINPDDVAKLLRPTYVERLDNQWKTVANCVDDLACGRVTSLPELVSVAFDTSAPNSPARSQIIRRANRLSGRVGKAGRAEARDLAQAALRVSVGTSGTTELSAHVARIGFNRNLETSLCDLVSTATIGVRAAIRTLKHAKRKFVEIEDPVTAEQYRAGLAERDKAFTGEFLRRDQASSAALACIVGQIDMWVAIQSNLSIHAKPYPFDAELIVTQACLTRVAVDGDVKFDDLPMLPNELQTVDSSNCPLLFCLSEIQSKRPVPAFPTAARGAVEQIAQQILLEIIFIRGQVE